MVHVAGCKESTKKVKEDRAHGSIKSIDVQAHTVVLAEKQADPTLKDAAKVRRTFKVADDCKISIAGKGLSDLSGLKVGDHITIKFTKERGELVAHHIYPHTGAPETPAAK